MIDNVLLVTAFPLYFLPTFAHYTGLNQHYDRTTFHQFILVYVLPVAFVAQTATIWVTVLVAVNRYIAVCRPYQVNTLRPPPLLRVLRFLPRDAMRRVLGGQPRPPFKRGGTPSAPNFWVFPRLSMTTSFKGEQPNLAW